MADPTGGFLSSYVPLVNTVLYILMGAIAVGGIGLIWWRVHLWRAFNIQIRVYSKRRDGYKTWDDWGAYLKNKKTGEAYGFKLKKMKTMMQPPNYEDLMTSPKGNILHLFQLSNDEFFVLRPHIHSGNVETELELKVIEGDIQLWGTTMIDRLITLYSKPNWWDKYGAYVLFGIATMMILLMIYLTLQKFDVLKEVAASFRDSASILQQLKGGAVPSVAPK